MNFAVNWSGFIGCSLLIMVVWCFLAAAFYSWGNFLAKLTGCPILPVAAASSPAIKLKTWDNYEIPIPFSKAAIVYGEHYELSRKADQTKAAEELRKKLQALTEEAEKMIK